MFSMVFHRVLTLKVMPFQGNLLSFSSQGPMAAASFVSWLGTSDAATLPCAVLPGPHGVYHGLTWPHPCWVRRKAAQKQSQTHSHNDVITCYKIVITTF